MIWFQRILVCVCTVTALFDLSSRPILGVGAKCRPGSSRWKLLRRPSRLRRQRRGDVCDRAATVFPRRQTLGKCSFACVSYGNCSSFNYRNDSSSVAGDAQQQQRQLCELFTFQPYGYAVISGCRHYRVGRPMKLWISLIRHKWHHTW